MIAAVLGGLLGMLIVLVAFVVEEIEYRKWKKNRNKISVATIVKRKNK